MKGISCLFSERLPAFECQKIVFLAVIVALELLIFLIIFVFIRWYISVSQKSWYEMCSYFIGLLSCSLPIPNV